MSRPEHIGSILRRYFALPPSQAERDRRVCPDCKGACVSGYSDGATGTAIACKRCRGRGFVIVRPK